MLAIAKLENFVECRIFIGKEDVAPAALKQSVILLLKTCYSGRLIKVPARLLPLSSDNGAFIAVQVGWQKEPLWVAASDLLDSSVADAVGMKKKNNDIK